MKQFNSYLIITIGLFINALGWTAFLIPSEIIGGGVSGIASLIFFSTHIPVGITIFLVNILLIGAAIKILGSNYGTRTIYSITIASLFFSLLQRYIEKPVVSDGFMAAIIGGILAGAGIGIVFTQGGSTGGTDIIASIINKYRNISIGRIILSLDLIIIASSYFLFHSLEKIVYGYVTMSVTAYVIDLIIIGSRQSVQITVISDMYSKIAERISSEMIRGITVLNGTGWYSGNDKKVLIIMVRKYELAQVIRIVKEEDIKAFMTVSNVMGVYGKGFDAIKE